jgi:hypothetical protein
VSAKVRREPKIHLSAQTLFAESTRSSSRRRPGSWCRAPSPRAFWLSLSAKGLADGTASTPVTAVPVRQICRELGIHGSQRRNTHDARNTFAESKPSSVSTWALLTVKFSKKKLHIFEPKLFPCSTYTHTMYMFKIGAILSLFAIFNNFTSLYVIFLIRPI